MKRIKQILLLMGGIALTFCSKDDTVPIKSNSKQIISFRFTDINNNGITVDIPGEIDEQNKAIAVQMPSGTDVTALEPVVDISISATLQPTGQQDFSKPINYTVTAADGTSNTYLVLVEVALSQKEILLKISNANPENRLDWKQGDNLSDWEEVTLDGNGQITELILKSRSLSVLPPEIGQLEQLQILDLEVNNIVELPPEIGRLVRLQQLYLYGNQLSTLPVEIGQLRNLTILHLAANTNLTALPSEIGLLNSLESIHLYRTSVSILPSEIGQLSSLQLIEMYQSTLTSLPPEIGQLGSLKEMHLWQTNLSSLPVEIGQLSSLEVLNVSENNNLTTLPSEIGQLSSLLHLSLGYNDLVSIPASIGQLTNLETLFLGGNRFISIPGSVCELETNGNTEIDVVPGIFCSK